VNAGLKYIFIMKIKLTVFLSFCIVFIMPAVAHFSGYFSGHVSENSTASLQRDTRGHGNCDVVMSKS